MSAMGPYKGLKTVRRVVEDCINNVHPIYHIKTLMIKRELAKNPEMANENWDRCAVGDQCCWVMFILCSLHTVTEAQHAGSVVCGLSLFLCICLGWGSLLVAPCCF